LNILMVSLDFPPTVGGIAAHVFELSRALHADGHRVKVVTRALSGRAAPATHEGIELQPVRLHWAPLYGWQLNRAVERQLAAFRPDVIHIHGMAPLKGYKVAGVPLAYTNHTSGYLKRLQRGSARQRALLAKLFAKPGLFLAPSRELLETPFPIVAIRQFIPNGVDARKYRFDAASRARIRAELGLADGDRVGILTRRLVEKNGVIHLARAAALVKDPRLKLILIGDGPEEAAVRAELKRGFAGRFRMLGAMAHDAIIPYYSAADFSILPSLMEATSISGLEAMACARPLVGTRVGGIPDLIADGRTGLLCAPADPADLAARIDALLAADLQAMGAAGRARIEAEFAWPQIARATAAAYRALA
jgi:glycosyltransferase involved in cell wall biosynthesis